MKEILKLDHIQKYYGNGGNVTKAVPARLPSSTVFPPLIPSVQDISIWTEPM